MPLLCLIEALLTIKNNTFVGSPIKIYGIFRTCKMTMNYRTGYVILLLKESPGKMATLEAYLSTYIPLTYL